MTYRLLSLEETIGRLRQVPLYGQPDQHVYKDADIVLKSLDVSTLFFAQRYVLRPILERIASRLEDMAQSAIDGLALSGAVVFDDGRQTFMPPVIEQCPLSDGQLLVADGMHRCYLAFRRKCPITVLCVSGLPAAFPYYAECESRDWETLMLCDVRPPQAERKRYRDPGDYKRLFRLYNAVFANVQPARDGV